MISKLRVKIKAVTSKPFNTGIIPFSDCREFAASLVSGVVSFMVEGRVGSVKGLKNIFLLSISNSNLLYQHNKTLVHVLRISQTLQTLLLDHKLWFKTVEIILKGKNCFQSIELRKS